MEIPDDICFLVVGFGFTVIFFKIACAVARCDNDDHDHDNNHDHDNIDHHNHDNSDDHVIIPIMECAGIKPSVLRSIPVVDFSSRDFKDGVVCAVCLSDFVDGDKAMVLPSCCHCFHADCITTWLQAHSDCPLCRQIVASERRGTRPELGGDESSEHPGLPTDPPRSTNPAVVEDADCGEANEAG